MRTHCLLLLTLVIALSGCCHNGDPACNSDPTPSPVTIERVAYKGWPEAWRMRNERCELIVVPAVSRVMHFSLAGGKNVLWENPELAGRNFPTDDGTWHNIGGEKLWPTQQKDYFKKFTGHADWPPPWPWDGGPSRAQAIANGVRLTLPHDKRFGAHGVREFTLDEKEPLVHVRQWMEKTEGEPAEMTVWTICQVNDPVLTLLPCADGKYANLGPPTNLIETKAGVVTVGRDTQKGLKIGIAPTEKNGWVASVLAQAGGRLMLVQSHKLVAGGHYPDGGIQAELYMSPTTFASYTEMELLSPLVALKAGEKLEDDAVWQLVPVTEGNEVSIAQRAHDKALEQLK